MASTSEISPALQPMCPLHPEVVAGRTCDRCGRFVCASCMSSGGRCRDCIRQYVATVPSSGTRSRRVVLFLRLSGVVGACNLLIYAWAVLVPGAHESQKTME